MIRSRVLPAVVALSLILSIAGCSSDDSSSSSSASASSSTTAAVTTTTAPAKDDPAYAGEGPNLVGSRTIELPDGRRAQVWYPAADSAADLPEDNFDIAALLSPELQSQIPADKRPEYEINSHAGAEPAPDGPYPVVLFSHGYAGFPEQSADLVTHLSSWGFVVIAPDHVERSLDGLLGTAAEGVAPSKDPAVLSAALDAAIADAETEGSPLADLMDLDQVAVAGHSAGAGAAYATASSDDRVKAFISYSVGLGGREGQEVPPVPDIPGMVMAGSTDGIIPVAASKAVFDAMHSPKYFVQIDGAGHLVFSDICLIGRDQGGLVGLVEQVGLDLPANLLRLASDGCQPDDLDPTDAFAAIDHFSVAFLRYSLGIDPEPVGLTPATAKTFDTAEVTLVADPG